MTSVGQRRLRYAPGDDTATESDLRTLAETSWVLTQEQQLHYSPD